MRDLDKVFAALARSTFRSQQRLRGRDVEYLQSKGLALVLQHARELIAHRLAPAAPPNDGRQTPFRGHPVFVAQHATATCCRTCLEKWHGIAQGHSLGAAEQDYVVAALERCLRGELERTRDLQPVEPTAELPLEYSQ
ncbi:MAG TPA: DUF4186 domain-containing protein [Chthoniobacterales bacterium]